MNSKTAILQHRRAEIDSYTGKFFARLPILSIMFSIDFHNHVVCTFRRIKQDVVEIIEQSLDCNLSGSCVKFQFEGTPILEGGVSIHETRENVIILVVTVASVHRLVFPHPNSFSFVVSCVSCILCCIYMVMIDY